MRFALTGGPGWARTLLTAAGVGLGVVVLMLAASVPHMLAERDARADARTPIHLGEDAEAGQDTVLTAYAGTEYRDAMIGGLELQPDAGVEETTAQPPPGVDAWPGPGEMVVSPALRDLLDSEDGGLLAERLDHTTVGIIGPEGLEGPSELYYYAGVDTLEHGDDMRVGGFGTAVAESPLPAILVLLILVLCVVLLMPVAVFIATAVRFGGERRDQRLAALRLVGADADMTRRIAAGEALVGALFGLVAGVGAFLALRQYLGSVTVWEFSAYPRDIVPSPVLTMLILVGVPVAAVAASLFALRGVAIEPLGVVRESTVRRRRLMWRLVPGALGLLLLLPFTGPFTGDSGVEQIRVASGVVLLLAGVTVLLPWLVERVVGLLRGGPVSWQLATRRLQLGSGAAARTVSGITVAVAGATALHMLFFGVRTDQTEFTGHDPDRAQLNVSQAVSEDDDGTRLIDRLETVPGVTAVFGTVSDTALPQGSAASNGAVTVIVGDCATLREATRAESCEDGDVFLADDGSRDTALPAPGEELLLGHDLTADGAERRLWTVPETASVIDVRPDARGVTREVAVYATWGALDPGRLQAPWLEVMLRVDPGSADVVERVRNAAWEGETRASVWQLRSETVSDELLGIQQGLLVGATGVMLLIGASMIVSMFEQLRERRRLLSVLVAFGTRRSTLAASVLWQTAVPVVLGLAVAALIGTVLGAVLMSLAGLRVGGWTAFLPMAGAGAGVIALVTLASLPLLWRLMRPAGLRTE
ncbi:ABC transporter permease [Streptomyces marincola]|uniref:ABC transporter permease n=1 Tax=Streptomyces marincola TaxID=2878388 RepID=UPI001CF17C61|nr:ABC transporter permease [Streptomyces marincola]UCM90091.1 ABC transporter permease [Streptomyces marincola]